MGKRKISQAELLELVGEGATIHRQDRPATIERFDDLIVALEKIAAGNETLAKADLARSQAQLEVLATIQGLVRRATNATKVHAAPTDLGPLKEVLLQIHEANDRELVAYKFDIQRGEGGYMAGVTATPITPTKH